MGQQRGGGSRSRSRLQDPTGRQAALQTEFAMGQTECRRQTQHDRRRLSPLTVPSHVEAPRRQQGGLMRLVRRTPPNARDARNYSRARRKSPIRTLRTRKRHRRNDTPEHKRERGSPRGRDSNLPGNKRIVGAHADGIGQPKNEETQKDTRMATSPTPPPRNLLRDAPAFNSCQNENSRNTIGKT